MDKKQEIKQNTKIGKWLIALVLLMAGIVSVISYINYSCIAGQTNWLTDLVYGDKCVKQTGYRDTRGGQQLSVRGTTLELSGGGEIDLSFLVGSPIPGLAGIDGVNGSVGTAGPIGITGAAGPAGSGVSIPAACAPGELLTSNGTNLFCVSASGGGTLDSAYNYGGPAAGRIINAEPSTTLGVEIRTPYDPGNFSSYNTSLRLVGDGTGQNCLTCGMAFGKFNTGGTDSFGEIYSTNINDLTTDTFAYQLYQPYAPGFESYSLGLIGTGFINYGSIDFSPSQLDLRSENNIQISANNGNVSVYSDQFMTLYSNNQNIQIAGWSNGTNPGNSAVGIRNNNTSYELLDLCNGQIPVFGCIKITAGGLLDPNSVVDGFAGSLYIASQTGVNASNALWVNTGGFGLNNNQWVTIGGGGGGSSLQLYDENYGGSYLYGAPNATGQNSVAIGDGSSASNYLSTSVGSNIVVNGSSSFAFGTNSSLNGDNSGLFGNNNNIGSGSSNIFSFGSNNYSGQNQGTVAIFGTGNYLNDSIFDAIVAGNNNGLSFAVNTSNVYGSNSTMGVGVNSSTLVGRSNSLGDGTMNSIVSGNSNIIGGGSDLSIFGGHNNLAQSNAYVQVVGRNNLFGSSNTDIVFVGNNNAIQDSNTLGLVLGNTNIIESSTSVVGGIGYRNTIGGGANQAYAVGVINTVSSSSSYAFGEYNSLSEGSNQLGVGFNNNIGNASNQVAFGSDNYLSSFNGQVGIGIFNNVSNTGATAVGQSNSISGQISSGFGLGNNVAGTSSLAAGMGNIVNGGSSAAVGVSNTSNDTLSFTFGYGNSAIAENTLSMGIGNSSNFNYGVSLGHSNVNNGVQSNAFGQSNNIGVSTVLNTAIGFSNNIGANQSISFGNNNTLNGDFSVLGGISNYVVSPNSIVYGSYNNSAGSSTAMIFGASNNINGSSSVTVGQGNFSDPSSGLAYSFGNSNTQNSVSNSYIVGQAVSQGSVSNNIAIGINLSTTDSNVIQMGQNGTAMTIQSDTIGGNVGIGTVTPTGVAPSRNLQVTGGIRVGALDAATATNVCIDGDGDLSACSSSRRYKDNIQDLGLGLDTIMGLRAVSFDWKGTGQNDFGFVAEEVAALNGLLATYNKQGEVQGVKYDQLTAILTNAIQEQQGKLEGINAQLVSDGLRVDELASELKDLAERVDLNIKQTNQNTVEIEGLKRQNQELIDRLEKLELAQ